MTRRWIVLVGVAVVLAGCTTRAERALALAAAKARVPGWYKGNTHTHTLESDGDSSPRTVAKWYKSHGYQFLVLSDHNVWVDPGKLADLVDSSFLLIPGEEVTTKFAGKPVHVNGLNLPAVVPPAVGTDLLTTVQLNIDNIRRVGGVPEVNHPNFRWALGYDVLAAAKNYKLLEIWNGNANTNNLGGGDTPSVETVWDMLLSTGQRIYGIAVDDAHHFTGEFAKARANPGRGWLMVRAAALNAQALLTAVEAGDFYASTGVILEDVTTDATGLQIHIRVQEDEKYITEFVGAYGKVLATSADTLASYHFTGDEKYVRARVRSSTGDVAWVQPVFRQ